VFTRLDEGEVAHSWPSFPPNGRAVLFTAWRGSAENSIAQTAMNEDITDPTQELTVHVDQHTGSVVGRGGWNDYGLTARAVAAGFRCTPVLSDGGISSVRAWCVYRSLR
jgi:uncharacterized iron-regulated membrane protein